MASFDEHLKQAQNNISCLKNINSSSPNSIDWQITICFYTALHITHAHFADKSNSHYKTHEDLHHAINHENKLSEYRLTKDANTEYKILFRLSKKARYLSMEGVPAQTAVFVKPNDLAKAIIALDRLIVYFSAKYPTQMNFTDLEVTCDKLIQSDVSKFTVISLPQS